jgi:hypothetical protein
MFDAILPWPLDVALLLGLAVGLTIRAVQWVRFRARR